MDQKNDSSVVKFLQINSTTPLFTSQERVWCVVTWRLLNSDARREENLKHRLKNPPLEFSEEKQRINASEMSVILESIV